MDKNEIIAFFDSLAPVWDEASKEKADTIEFILDKGDIKEGSRVLDVACGTGVLFPFYMSRRALVTGIDISAEMVKLARKKFPSAEIICGDAESCCFEKSFDAVMIYNAFPHFANPEVLFGNLAEYLEKGGRFTVAHGISEKEVEKCHESVRAKNVSLPLPSKEILARMMAEFFEIDVMISDEKMYIVSGVKK